MYPWSNPTTYPVSNSRMISEALSLGDSFLEAMLQSFTFMTLHQPALLEDHHVDDDDIPKYPEGGAGRRQGGGGGNLQSEDEEEDEEGGEEGEGGGAEGRRRFADKATMKRFKQMYSPSAFAAPSSRCTSFKGDEGGGGGCLQRLAGGGVESPSGGSGSLQTMVTHAYFVIVYV